MTGSIPMEPQSPKPKPVAPHFFGNLHGSAKTNATRTGTKKSGIYACVQGKLVGVAVKGTYDPKRNEDVFEFFATPGPKGEGPVLSMGVVRRKREGSLIQVAKQVPPVGRA